jgi:hypothetical protein
MVLRRDQEWLSITPEPEGELPPAIAALRAGGRPSPERVQAERDRAETLVSRARRRAYERWLADARAMAAATPAADPHVREAARVATDVIDNHDALALGLRRRGRGGRGGRGR